MRKFLFTILIFSILTFTTAAETKKLPIGYGGVELGMTLEEVKSALKKNSDFGYSGDRDVSLLPGENRTLIETDAVAGHAFSYLDRCWFQFYDGKLYTITLNMNKDRIDHYSVFSTLCSKYGNPNSLSPEKSVWQNDTVIFSLEQPLALKYVDVSISEKLSNASKTELSGAEITREQFLEGL